MGEFSGVNIWVLHSLLGLFQNDFWLETNNNIWSHADNRKRTRISHFWAISKIIWVPWNSCISTQFRCRNLTLCADFIFVECVASINRSLQFLVVFRHSKSKAFVEIYFQIKLWTPWIGLKRTKYICNRECILAAPSKDQAINLIFLVNCKTQPPVSISWVALSSLVCFFPSSYL